MRRNMIKNKIPPRNSKKHVSMAARKRRFWILVLAVALVTGTGTLLYGHVMPNTGKTPNTEAELARRLEKLGMPKGSVGIDITSNRAWASGVGRMADNTAQEKLLARRAALVDARRNLIALRQELQKTNFKPGYVTGRITGKTQTINAERIEGSLYFLEVEMSLDELMRTDFDEKSSL